MNWLDKKYALLLSNRLEKFKTVKGNLNFRCPICGDSKKSKTKTRAWLLSSNGLMRFYCHNCHRSLRFDKFLKLIDSQLYYDYIGERIAENKNPEPIVDEKKFITTTKFEIRLKKVSQLRPDHPCKLYVSNRLIPSEFHYKLFYAPKFKEWVNTLIPNKFEDTSFEEPRLVFPFYDENDTFFGFQGRSFRKDAANKYITIMLDENKPKIFGLERVNYNRPLYIVEGPIDSLFIPNTVASCGGSLESDLFGQMNTTIVYDNEPRATETCAKIHKAIKHGWKVCLWPESVKFKDINDMILNKYTANEVKNIIDSNSYRGLEAELNFALWRKA